MAGVQIKQDCIAYGKVDTTFVCLMRASPISQTVHLPGVTVWHRGFSHAGWIWHLSSWQSASGLCRGVSASGMGIREYSM